MKFTAGAVYSRLSQTIAQDSGRLITILLLSYVLPTAAISLLIAIAGNNNMGDIVSNVLDFITSTICLCLFAQLIEARQKSKPFALRPAVATAFGQLLPLFGVSLLSGMIMLVGAVLLIVPGIIAAVGLCVAAPAYIYEPRTGITDSISRSWQLTRNHRLTIALIFLPVFMAFAIAVALLIVLPETLFTPTSSAVIYILVGTLMTAIINLLVITIYTTLREVKEGHTPEVTAAVFD